MDDLRGRGNATVRLEEMRRGQVALCLGTALARVNTAVRSRLRSDVDCANQQIAFVLAQGQLAYYQALADQGRVRIIRTVKDLEDHWAAWDRPGVVQPLGLILSMEGADPIIDARGLGHWWKQGLRVVGLAHYGQGVYAGGTGTCALLSAAAGALLTEFQRRGIILDVTHLSDEAMGQALDAFGGVVLASHHNCRALVPGQRQLTDEQIRTLVQRDAGWTSARSYNPAHPRRNQSLPALLGSSKIVQGNRICAHSVSIR